MHAEFPETNLKSMKDWADRVACPVCFGNLYIDAERAVCAECGRAYPVVDGIAVLIGERAEPSSA